MPDIKVDDTKLCSVFQFEQEYESIRELITPKTLFSVDDKINSLQELRRKLSQRMDFLMKKVINSNRTSNKTNFYSSFSLISWHTLSWISQTTKKCRYSDTFFKYLNISGEEQVRKCWRIDLEVTNNNVYSATNILLW